MKDDEAAERKEFRILLAKAGITQRDLAELIGVNVMTVNRWLADRDYDTRPPPYYAIQFMRVYSMLPDAMRMQLPRRPLTGTKK